MHVLAVVEALLPSLPALPRLRLSSCSSACRNVTVKHRGHGVAWRIAQEDCSEGLLKGIAWWALVGAQVVFSIGFSGGGLICRVRGSQVLGAWKVGGLKVGIAVCWWAIFTQHGKDCRLLCGYWCVGMGSRGATQGPGGVARSFVCIAGHMVCAGERRHGLGHMCRMLQGRAFTLRARG